MLLTSAVDGQASTEERDGFRVIRRGGRFTVYPWSLLWIARHRRSIRAVIDSQNGIPFFTPLAVSKRTPVLLLLHHVHHELFPHYFSPVGRPRRPVAREHRQPDGLRQPGGGGRVPLHPPAGPAGDRTAGRDLRGPPRLRDGRHRGAQREAPVGARAHRVGGTAGPAEEDRPQSSTPCPSCWRSSPDSNCTWSATDRSGRPWPVGPSGSGWATT